MVYSIFFYLISKEKKTKKQKRANAVPNSGFLTSRMVSRGKSDTWPSNVPSMSPTLALLLSELDAIVKMTIGLV